MLASLPSSTDHPNARSAGLFAILATQYVYVGFTEFNDSRRGTLMRRSNRERIAVQERTEIDGMTVRSLDRERCVLAQGPNTYTLYLVDMDYIERVRNQLPLPVPAAGSGQVLQRYYEEMFNRPERARNARVGEVNYPTRPLSPEEEEEGKRAYVDATLGPKLDRMRQGRSGKNLHPGAALSPDERGNRTLSAVRPSIPARCDRSRQGSIARPSGVIGSATGRAARPCPGPTSRLPRPPISPILWLSAAAVRANIKLLPGGTVQR
ncbi:hypothetical protein HS125_02550 [bacterium]|nr:hypothetical protein [bacterium]